MRLGLRWVTVRSLCALTARSRFSSSSSPSPAQSCSPASVSVGGLCHCPPTALHRPIEPLAAPHIAHAAVNTMATSAAPPLPSAASPGAVVAKLYQCSNCKKTFRLVNALNHHIKTKHGGDGSIVVVGPDGKPIEGASPQQTPQAAPTTPQAPTAPQPTAAAAAAPTPAATAATEAKEQPAKASEEATRHAEPTTAAASSSPQEDQQQQPPPSDDDVEKRSFVCTVCQKGFRLEAALAHHYQAKHGMDPPTAPVEKPTTATTDAGSATPSAVTPTTAEGASTTTTTEEPKVQFTHDEGADVPQPPHYHLDVAPNAPEESEIAAHSRCVNHVLLVGSIQDIQSGFVFEEPCVQFTLVTDFENPAPGDPEKDFHVVRVFGENFIKMVKPMVKGGSQLLVNGRLRLVPQWEQATSKYFHFPVVHVREGCGSVHVVVDAADDATASSNPPSPTAAATTGAAP